MARIEINRSGEMEMFVRVVEAGGLSAAARLAGMTPSAVSRLVARLEARLGARLVNRSTRRLQLTAEGCAFYERSLQVLADLDEAERSAAGAEQAAGRLRVSVNVPIGRQILLPRLGEFLARHPRVVVDVVLTDEVVDLIGQRTDIAIRSGPLKASGLIARKLGEAAMVIVGAPAYLDARGRPAHPADLAGHNRLGFGFTRASTGWPLRDGDGLVVMPARGNALAGDGDALRLMALAGLGLARLAAFQVRDDIAAGRLEAVLEACNPGDREPVHAVFLGQGGLMPARVRAFLDFLAEAVRID
jgi:DNA-binding transcriptional LysR family regulator